MEEPQTRNTATLDMQPSFQTSPAPLMDKGKRKICDLYTRIPNEQQLLCNLLVLLFILDFLDYIVHS
jgi:hypothetical protein